MNTDEQPPSDPAASESPRARTLFRQGAVYGLAGALKAADVAVAAARGAVRGARQGVEPLEPPDHDDPQGEPPAAA